MGQIFRLLKGVRLGLRVVDPFIERVGLGLKGFKDRLPVNLT